MKYIGLENVQFPLVICDDIGFRLKGNETWKTPETLEEIHAFFKVMDFSDIVVEDAPQPYCGLVGEETAETEEYKLMPGRAAVTFNIQNKRELILLVSWFCCCDVDIIDLSEITNNGTNYIESVIGTTAHIVCCKEN